jgi:PadR family transcriptional regulator PadR
MKGVMLMSIDKNLITGSTAMLILKLLDNEDMYGYQMIKTLAQKSDDTFSLKAGTLYPLLHNLENQDMINSYEMSADTGRLRKYYSITKRGKKMLAEKENEWRVYVDAINQVLQGGENYAILY